MIRDLSKYVIKTLQYKSGKASNLADGLINNSFNSIVVNYYYIIEDNMYKRVELNASDVFKKSTQMVRLIKESLIINYIYNFGYMDLLYLKNLKDNYINFSLFHRKNKWMETPQGFCKCIKE